MATVATPFPQPPPSQSSRIQRRAAYSTQEPAQNSMANSQDTHGSPAAPDTSRTVSSKSSRRQSMPVQLGSSAMYLSSRQSTTYPPDVPSSSSDRTVKLERIRRTLGDDVPEDAVFPESTSQSSSTSKKQHRKSTHNGPRPPLLEIEEPSRSSAHLRDDISEMPLLKSKRREKDREFFVKDLIEPIGFMRM